MSVGVTSGRHLQALLGSLGRLARSPLASFLTLLVIALALALPAALKLFVTNAQAATGNFASAVDVSVYLKTDVPLAKAQQLTQAAQQRPDVAAVTLISAVPIAKWAALCSGAHRRIRNTASAASPTPDASCSRTATAATAIMPGRTSASPT